MNNSNISTISSQISKTLAGQTSVTSLSSASSQTTSSSSLAVNSASLTLIDAIILCIPTIDSSPKRQQEFLTELFKTMLDHLLTSDLFNENPTIASSTSPHTALPHFYQFIDRLCDKLWDGVYKRDPKELFETLFKFLTNLKRKPFSNSYAHEQLINAINRVLLFQLSRPSRHLNEQITMLDVLHKMNKLKTFLFSNSGGFVQPEFYGCLAYCLLQITLHKSGSSVTGSSFDNDDDFEEIKLKTKRSESRENVVDLAKTPSKTQWYINTMFNETVVNSGTNPTAGIQDEKVKI
jgi:hypothetical protein